MMKSFLDIGEYPVIIGITGTILLHGMYTTCACKQYPPPA
jgi:hypothetical protein